MRWELRAAERRKRRDPGKHWMRVRISGLGDLVFENGICIEAPARLAAAIGRSAGDVQRYCWKRGWQADVIA